MGKTMINPQKNARLLLGLWAILFIIVTPSRGAEKSFISLEFFGSAGFVDPQDFNLIGQTDALLENYFLGQKYQAWQTQYQPGGSRFVIETGNYPEFTQGFPLGLRVVLNFSQRFKLWGGVKYFDLSSLEPVSYKYRAEFGPDYIFLDQRDYSTYTISATAWTVQAGIKFIALKGEKIELGIIGGIGTVFAKCNYERDWEDLSSLKFDAGIEDQIEYFSKGFVQMEGKGSGMSFEGGIFLNWNISETLGIFLESVYVSQKIGDISGPGVEILDGVETTWEGKWVKVTEQLDNDELGQLTITYPENRTNSVGFYKSVDEFFLDLSGFEFRLGFSISF